MLFMDTGVWEGWVETGRERLTHPVAHGVDRAGGGTAGLQLAPAHHAPPARRGWGWGPC